MSTIVIVGKLVVQEVSFKEAAEYLGHKKIVVDWKEGDPIPDDSLILFKFAMAVDFGVLWEDLELEILRQKIKPDLLRDLKEVLLDRFLVCKEFTLSAVTRRLNIERCSNNVRRIVHESLLEMGCQVSPKAYDLHRTWYKAPGK